MFVIKFVLSKAKIVLLKTIFMLLQTMIVLLDPILYNQNKVTCTIKTMFY